MTPKEKSQDLYGKMRIDLAPILAKQCALIAVDEIIEAIDWHYYETPNNEIQYWEEVKQEIEKL